MKKPTITDLLPASLASLDDFEAFQAQMRTAAPCIERLNAIGSCLSLAAALEAHPLAARIRLAPIQGFPGARVEFEAEKEPGVFTFPMALIARPPNEPPGIEHWALQRFPGLSPGGMVDLFYACNGALEAALTPLMERAPSRAAHAKAFVADQPGPWILRGARPFEIAHALGLPDIAAELEAMEIGSDAAAATPNATSRHGL